MNWARVLLLATLHVSLSVAIPGEHVVGALFRYCARRKGGGGWL